VRHQEGFLKAENRCKYLGLDDDQYTCMTFATEIHHCYRLSKHKAAPIEHQYQFCLNDNHIRCPVFLSGDHLFPKVVKSHTSPKRTFAFPTNESFPKSVIKWMIVLAVVFLLGGAVWWVFANTDLLTRPDPPVQASGDLPPGVTPTITRTVEMFSPNMTLVYDLTSVSSIQITPAMTLNIPVTSQNSLKPSTTATATIVACSLPEGWVVYTVKLWDTLYWLSLSVRTSVEELMSVNCLNSTRLIVGQQIFLPYAPPKSSFTPLSTLTPVPPDPTRTRTPVSTFTRTFTATNTRTSPPIATFTITNTPIPPTNTAIVPTDVPPTEIPPTDTSPTEVPPTEVPPTESPTDDPGG
jgi:LysM repeat protein